MKIRQVRARINVQTDGGDMEFMIEGPAKGVKDMTKLGAYIGEQCSQHMAAFVGMDQLNGIIDALKEKLSAAQRDLTRLETQVSDAEELAKHDRIERMRKQRALPVEGHA